MALLKSSLSRILWPSSATPFSTPPINLKACTFPSNVSGGVLWITFAPFAASAVLSHWSLPIGSVLLLSPCLNCRDLVPDSSPPRELCAAYLWTSYVDTQNADHSARNSAAPERKTLWCPATVRLRVEILVRAPHFYKSVSLYRCPDPNLFCLLLLNKPLPLPSLNVLPKEWIFSFFGVIVEYFLFSHFVVWSGFLIFIVRIRQTPKHRCLF